ncbi:transposase [Nonomuraea coxensis]|uniref:transposase n=1 Tax=Nonomuraea coxensis TaxID=404386 RepID=UPI001FE414C1|nr:transposase [Nonomuraea coxensis]
MPRRPDPRHRVLSRPSRSGGAAKVRWHRELTLADRVWRCGCGLVHDRDVNAARNLLEAMNLEQEAA